MSLSQAISQAKDLGIWLHEKANGRYFEVDRRGKVAVALLQHSLDIADAIIILVSKLPGPALALARPLLEGFVRGVWILKCASDEQIERFAEGNPPGFSDLLQAMNDEDRAKIHASWIRQNMDPNKKNFHDFTHGGIEHVLRRISETALEPNYPEHELVYLMGLVIETYIRVGCELFRILNDNDATKQLYEKTSALHRSPLEQGDLLE